MFKNKQKITVSNYFYLTPERCGPFFLVQAGESFCSGNTIIPPHNQRCFELTYAIDGSAVCYADDIGTKINAGDCFFSFPGEVHKIESDTQNPLHFIFLAFFAKEKTRESRYIEFLRSVFSSPGGRVMQTPEISGTLMQILKELKSSDEYTSRMIASRLTELLIECCRKIDNKPTLVYQTKHSDAEMLAKDIINYIGENVESIVSAKELSDVFHYSLPNLSKIFRMQTGLPIGKYICAKRMELANRLLDEGQSVTAVSEKLNYSSIHTFSRAYKIYFHTTPSAKKAK